MEAAEAKIQKVLEGTKQFLVPHYQRPYSWTADQWKTLWRDVLELLEDPEAKPHFLGSIVTSPARTVPEGVEKRLLIDGQQRLTTLLVLLTLVRDRAREKGLGKLADRIDDLVTNRHEDGPDHYKLLPTQSEDATESDREAFVRLVHGSPSATKSGIGAAYEFFAGRLRRADAPDLDDLLRVLITRLTLVSIILDDRDNPHRIFESLNGKGRPLSQADLIRNYFFMRLPHKEVVPGASLTIEHVMPQTLSDSWKDHLGTAWEEDHEQFLHTLGNLTLTNYNAELSNAPYGEKRKLFATSHVELNRYFESVERWTAAEIEHRSEVLTDVAISLWPSFGAPQGDAGADTPEDLRVTGKVPRSLRVRGEERTVQSWVDVTVVTMEAIAKIGDDEFSRVTEEMPKFANRDATAFRRTSRLKKLSNGAYVETNISASTIHRLCVQAVQLAGLDREDWSVEYATAPAA
jgi:Protein of unknown function DUF262/Protein of unknown function (DUF1524)